MNSSRWLVLVTLVGVATPVLAADLHVLSGGSITTAVASAVAGDRVLVQEGTYFEHVTLKEGVALRGGYDASFSEGSRNPSARPTVIHGSGTGPAVASGSSITSATVVDGFVLTGGGGSPGAGVLVAGGAPVFSNNDISGNRRAGAGGGAFVHSGSSARFEDNTFRDNSSVGSGGGIRVESSPAVLVGNTFQRCVAPHSGGAVYALNSAVACSSNVVQDCVSGEGGGGGYYFQHCSGAKVIGGSVENCRGPFGGGLYSRDDTSLQLNDVEFTGCHATTAGGGAALMNYSVATFVDCRFDGCSSDGGGGGAWALSSTVNFMGLEATEDPSTASFLDCTAVGAGGGYRAQSCTGTIQSVRFEGCSSDSMGGGYFGTFAEYTLRRNAFVSCSAFDGGGLALYWPTAPFRSSNIWNNTFWGCSATGPNLAGAMQIWAAATQRIAFVQGNVVANTLAGACIRCGNTSSTAFGRPTFLCNTVNRNGSNPTPELPSGGCSTAFTATTNFTRDPLLCGPPSNLQLQLCSPEVGANNCPNTDGGKVNRGAAPDGAECSCGGFVSAVEPSTWGKIKTMYR